MNWLSGNTLLGLFLILLGVSIFIKEIFGISIPLVRLALALFFIYLGFSLINGMHSKSQQSFMFSNQTVRPSSSKPSSYQTIFGNSTLDLTKLHHQEKPPKLHISTIFGNTTIYIDPSIPTEITTQTSFGEVRLPDGAISTHGYKSYSSHAADPELILRVHTTFGKTTIKEKHLASL